MALRRRRGGGAGLTARVFLRRAGGVSVRLRFRRNRGTMPSGDVETCHLPGLSSAACESTVTAAAARICSYGSDVARSSSFYSVAGDGLSGLLDARTASYRSWALAAFGSGSSFCSSRSLRICSILV